MVLPSSKSKWLAGMALGLALLVSSISVAAYPVIQQAGPHTAALTGQQADNSSGSYSESISLGGPVVITGVYWWGYYAEGSDLGTDAFVANGFNASTAGLITRTFFKKVDDGSGGLVDLYQYYLDLNDAANSVNFAGGTAIGELVNDSLDVAWFWQGATGDVAGARSYALEGYRNQNELPEPSSLLLFGLALTSLAVMRIRQSRAQSRSSSPSTPRMPGR